MSKRPISQTSHNTLRREFEDALEAARRNESWRSWEVATTWIDAAHLALHGRRLDPNGPLFAANEAAYMKIVGRCRKPTETMGEFGKALGIAARALRENTVDFLGEAFMKLCANEHIGQFFTPPEVCSLIVRLAGVPTPPADGSPITVLEPTAGVGAMLLATAEYFHECGVDLATGVHFTAIDIDASAAKACFIQLELAGLSADVVHGNTLSLETFAQWPTTAALRARAKAQQSRAAELPLAAE